MFVYSKKIIHLFLISFLVSLQILAQQNKPVQFSFQKYNQHNGVWQLVFKANLQPGIKLYGLDSLSDSSPFSSIQFDMSAMYKLDGKIISGLKPHFVVDSILGTPVSYYLDSADWKQTVLMSVHDSLFVKGVIHYMYNKDGVFIGDDQPFRFYIYSVKSAANEKPVSTSLWWIFITAFAGGFLALLTPCIYSMIPVTVGFFTKKSIDRQTGIRNAIFYAISIIIIFTFLGCLITVVFGPAALNNIATNWIANIIFFILFLFFGISFLGAFDIRLPSSWTNKTDSKASSTGFAGIFFMALTLVIVSFSCTGPIVGNLLVLASRGNYFGPLVGMAGFSTALAMPFAMFAFFPGKLNVLAKAGGWLNVVKVTFGFLELALALKFLSNADLARGWRILDRETFLVLWIVIFILLGLYLLGKLRFHHDDELPRNDFGVPYLSVTRLLVSILALAFSVYMIPGLWGAPLKGISAFVPPMGTQDFNESNNLQEATLTQASASVFDKSHPIKYVEQMKVYEPEVVTKYGMEIYYDYEEALKASKIKHKPLMLDFTGINCVNCRKMEGQVWSDPAVLKMLKEDFIIVSLYVDANNIDLQESEQYESKALGKKIETLGEKNVDFQVSHYNANSQPYYFFVDASDNKLADEGYGYDSDVHKFIRHLQLVLDRYKTDNPS